MTTPNELVARLEAAIAADGNAYEVVLSIGEAKQVLDALKLSRVLSQAEWVEACNSHLVPS